MNTQNLQPLRRSVSQLAKTHFLTLKTNEIKDLEVGRQQEKTPHVRASEPAHDFKEQNAPILTDLTAMTYLNRLFSDLLPNIKVCYHNPLYVQQIEEAFTQNESCIFLQFVKTFAQFRQADRIEAIENVILTNESDFLLAYKLMQQRKIEEYATVKPKHKNRFLDLLQLKFKQRTFSPQILVKELHYDYKLVSKLITLLSLERKIEFFKEVGEHKMYRLRQEPIVYVTYR